MRFTNRKGFSLVELLTVIAIIAILAAIIFPVMSGVKERARQNDCMTKLRQIAAAVGMFKNENRRFPITLGPRVHYRNAGGVLTLWNKTVGTDPEAMENVNDANSVISERGMTAQAFHCPSSTIINTRDVAMYTSGSGAEIYVYAYDSYDWGQIGRAHSGMVGNVKIYEQTNDASTNRVVPHYRPDWAPGDENSGPAWIMGSGLLPYPIDSPNDLAAAQRDYSRQLRFKEPPSDTVLTWCSLHEGDDLSGKAIVVFLDGNASWVPANEMEQCKWRMRQPK